MNIFDVFSQRISGLGGEPTVLALDGCVLQVLGLNVSSGVPGALESLVADCTEILPVLKSQHCVNNCVKFTKSTWEERSRFLFQLEINVTIHHIMFICKFKLSLYIPCEALLCWARDSLFLKSLPHIVHWTCCWTPLWRERTCLLAWCLKEKSLPQTEHRCLPLSSTNWMYSSATNPPGELNNFK